MIMAGHRVSRQSGTPTGRATNAASVSCYEQLDLMRDGPMKTSVTLTTTNLTHHTSGVGARLCSTFVVALWCVGSQCVVGLDQTQAPAPPRSAVGQEIGVTAHLANAQEFLIPQASL